MEATGDVLTGKVTVFCPAGTTTDAGTTAFALLLERFTNTPPAGEALDNVTVPVAPLPETTGFGLMFTDPIFPVVGSGGFKPSTAVTLFADVAAMVAVCEVATGVVVIVNVPWVCPAGITIDGGTMAFGLVLVRLT